MSAAETATDKVVGDEVAALVDANTRALLAYFLRRVDQREDAADLLGETLLTVWRRVAVCPPDPDEARMWMYGIAANVLTNARRTLRRRAALADRLRGELASSSGDIESTADAERRLDVQRALAQLRPHDRELIRLVHWDGLTLAEAAAVIGMNASTARTRYGRARERLAAILSPR